MVKKLRFYARFIVVCLLLKKMKLVRDLVRVSQCSYSVFWEWGEGPSELGKSAREKWKLGKVETC